MSLSPAEEITHHFHHLEWLDEARIMADTPSAVEAGLSIDDTYHALSTIVFTYGMKALSDGQDPSDKSVAGMNAKTFFNAASAIDTVLSHGNADQVRKVATFAVELATFLPVSKQPAQKQGILIGLLGIDLPSVTPVAQQLVERRILPNGTPEEQAALTSAINGRARPVY